MKKWIIASGLVLISLSTMAQQRRGGERPSPEERATRMTERLAEELQLTDAQKAQVLEINLENVKNQEAKRAEMTDARKKEMEARREEMKKQDAKIKEVLTEEQKVKWEEIKKENREKRGRGDGNRRRGPHGPSRDDN